MSPQRPVTSLLASQPVFMTYLHGRWQGSSHGQDEGLFATLWGLERIGLEILPSLRDRGPMKPRLLLLLGFILQDWDSLWARVQQEPVEIHQWALKTLGPAFDKPTHHAFVSSLANALEGFDSIRRFPSLREILAGPEAKP